MAVANRKNSTKTPILITQIFNSNKNTAETASLLSNAVSMRNSSDSQPLPAQQPKPHLSRVANPFKIPSAENVLGFQEPLKNTIDLPNKSTSITTTSLACEASKSTVDSMFDSSDNLNESTTSSASSRASESPSSSVTTSDVEDSEHELCISSVLDLPFM